AADISIMRAFLDGNITLFPGCINAKASPCPFYGDIDKNGTIDVYDISAIQRIALAKNKVDGTVYNAEEKLLADVNNDNTVTIFDVLQTSNYVNKTPTSQVTTFAV